VILLGNHSEKALHPTCLKRQRRNCIVFGTWPACARIVAAAYVVALMLAVRLLWKERMHSFPARMKQAIHMGFTRLTEDIVIPEQRKLLLVRAWHTLFIYSEETGLYRVRFGASTCNTNR